MRSWSIGERSELQMEMWVCAEKNSGRSLRLPSESPVCKVDPCLASRNLICGCPHCSLTDKRVSMRLNCLCKSSGLCSTPASFQELGILVHARQRMPTCPALNKSRPLSWWWASLGDNISPTVSHSMLEELSTSVWLHRDRSLGSWPGFLQTMSHVPFPFADCALSSFPIIYLSCKHDHTLSPES